MTRSEALKLYQAAEAGTGTPGARKRWKLAARALGGLTCNLQAHQALTRAEHSHARADWREAARALYAAVTGEARPAVAVKAAPRPMSLCEFLSKAGGLADTGGDLAAIGADQWHRRAPFRRRLVADNGLGLDYAADLAAERGYIVAYATPGHGAAGGEDLHRIGATELLQAIERELAGNLCLPADSEWAPYVERPDDEEALWNEAYPEAA